MITRNIKKFELENLKTILGNSRLKTIISSDLSLINTDINRLNVLTKKIAKNSPRSLSLTGKFFTILHIFGDFLEIF